jgi:TonB family protein
VNFLEQLRHLLSAFLLCAVPILAFGSVSDADLQKEYGGRILTLRQFYPGGKLHFDATGKLPGTAAPGAWTVDGQLRVRKIFLKEGLVHIQGQRLFLFYDSESKQLRDVGTLTKGDKASKYFRKKIGDREAKTGKTEIEVECGEPQPEMADVTKAMNAVFLSPDEPLTDVLPDFWKVWLDPKGQRKVEVANAADVGEGKIHRVGGGISAFRATYAPDPDYSEPARQAGYQATTVLWLVVGPDGLPRNIRIQRPSGMGLDEQAVIAVQRWRFEPAKKDGQPVPVMINVEVNFRLY